MCHQAYSKGVKFLLTLLKEIRKKLATYIMIHFTLILVKFCWLKWSKLICESILDSTCSFWYQGRKIKVSKDPETWIKRAKIRSRLHVTKTKRSIQLISTADLECLDSPVIQWIELGTSGCNSFHHPKWEI